MNEKEKQESVTPESTRKERENPCGVCEDGEYQLDSTIPGDKGSTEVYKCDHCGHEVRVP
jgi:DNA-directed RNA polymerase subunit M/transcription elongation factor TFIIS